MKLKKYLKIGGFALSIISLSFLTSCETSELNLQDNPSLLTPETADPNLLLNNVQLSFANALAYNEDNQDGLNVRAAEFVRMQHLFGTYVGPFSLSAGSVDNVWRDLYRETLQDAKLTIEIAEARDLPGTSAVAKILTAYSYVTLIDVFGEVPFSEALLGADVPNPRLEGGLDVYNAQLTLLDEAITQLNTTGIVMPPNDIYFPTGSDSNRAANWQTVARTLKFKMYAQMRLLGDFSAEINTLISQGLIDQQAEDFQVNYGDVSEAASDNRHPYYALNYDTDGADDYLNSYYVNLLLNDKGFKDPRLRYYFYRQSPIEPIGDNLVCDGDPVINFCYVGDLYWTRDHGNNDGVQPDQLLRSTYGLYPIGGAFDSDQILNPDLIDGTGAVVGTANVLDSPGAEGAGIFPIMLSSYVKFLQAESALMAGTTGNPRVLLEEAIRASMDKVLNFIPAEVISAFASTPTDVNDYVTFVLNQYDAAASNEDKLDVIMKEYYIALWGNGIEAYNNLRRTGYPSDISSPVIAAGAFPRSFIYPAAAVNANSNISQKLSTVKVFWDTNPDGFVD